MSPSTPGAAVHDAPLSPPLERVLDEVLAQWAPQPGALLPVLHAVQARWHFIPPEAVPSIARALNLSRAEVHGVISFYRHFRTAPPGRQVLQVCMAEACQAMGAQALMDEARRLQHARGTAALTLEPVYCLGLCACAPALRLDEVPHARQSPSALGALLDAGAAP